ncbi:synaptophysin-like protein 2b [Clarias gariepinus]|uniref:synaptophysin-like protein 2b n=1 Tax=Clarias gariepinus TaxID=13013 RepID=UPI00234D8571|nr:synaptophysin-like protein 2b [Clarias gariepinus]
MESVGQQIMSGFRLDISPLKEPLGFIRLLEWVFVIFAFASTVDYSGNTSFNIQCHGTGPIHEINISFKYPFRLHAHSFDVPTCDGNKTGEMKTYYLSGDFSSSAQFFVAVGVLGFLYCTSILVVYVGYQHMYRESKHGPVFDLLITGIFTFLWLVASSAWGKGLTDVKLATSPAQLVSLINACRISENKCSPGALSAFGPLNSSVISGFLNIIIWAGNCWFIFKETHFHTQANPSATQQ